MWRGVGGLPHRRCIWFVSLLERNKIRTTWASCYVAGSIPTVTLRYCTNKIIHALQSTKKDSLGSRIAGTGQSGHDSLTGQPGETERRWLAAMTVQLGQDSWDKSSLDWSAWTEHRGQNDHKT